MLDRNLKEITRYNVEDVTPEIERYIAGHGNNELGEMLKEWLENGIEDFVSIDQTFKFNDNILYVYEYGENATVLLNEEYTMYDMVKVKFDDVDSVNEYLTSIDCTIQYLGGEKFFTFKEKGYKISSGKKRITLLMTKG